MITPVVMPQMGLEVTEGTVAAVHVSSGARVSEGDPLLEMETDKALTDVVAPRDGVIRSVEVEVGDTVAIGATLVVLAETADEEVEAPAPVPAGAAAPAAEAAPAGAHKAAAGAPEGSAPVRTVDGRPRAAPVARRAARRLGIDLEQVDGTGPRGRITLRDVERVAGREAGDAAGGRANGSAAAAAPAAATSPQPGPQDRQGDAGSPQPAPAAPQPAPAAPQPGGAAHQAAPTAPQPAGTSAQPAPATPAAPAAATSDGERREPMSPIRRAIARRMSLSQQIPQFTLTREVDASWLLEQKAALGRDGRGIGLNDLLLQAMAEVALRHPGLVATYVEDDDGVPQLLRRDAVDVGLAVATSRGLLVPVIRGVHERPLAQIAADRARLVGDARSGRLRQDDMRGAVMTLSNLSSFGVDHFTAMLNPGESAILAVGRVVDRVVPRGRGLEVVGTLTFTLTIDHRVADGATGAAALVELADLLEGGMTWRA